MHCEVSFNEIKLIAFFSNRKRDPFTYQNRLSRTKKLQISFFPLFFFLLLTGAFLISFTAAEEEEEKKHSRSSSTIFFQARFPKLILISKNSM